MPDSWVFWINGADIWVSYHEIAQRLQLAVDENLLNNVTAWMQKSTNGRWLAIIDDFDFDGTDIVLNDLPEDKISKSAWDQHLRHIWSHPFKANNNRSLVLATSNSISSWHNAPWNATQSLNQSIIVVPRMSTEEATDLMKCQSDITAGRPSR